MIQQGVNTTLLVNNIYVVKDIRSGLRK